MSFAEDIKNSNKCPDECSSTKVCDECAYKEAPECVPLRLADNLSGMGYARMRPMNAGVTLKGVFRCVFLFEDCTYIELDSEMIKNYEDLDFIKINNTVFRRVEEQ